MPRLSEFTVKIKREALQRSGNMCEICGDPLVFSTAQFHHKKPLQDGGTSDLSNCQVLCFDCHGGDEFQFRSLHPNAPARVLFNDSIPRKQRVGIAKSQQRRIMERDRDSKKRKTWTREKYDPFKE